MDYQYMTTAAKIEAVATRIANLEALHFDLTLNLREYEIAQAPEKEVEDLRKQIAQVVARVADLNQYLETIKEEGTD